MKFKVLILLIFIIRNCFVCVRAQSFDAELLKRFHTPTPQYADPFWRGVSNTTVAFSLMPTVGSGIGFLLEKKDEKRRLELKKQTIEMGSAWVLATGLMYVSKKAFARDRPFAAYPQFFTAKMTEETYSFPSGHTTVAFVAATSLSLRYPRWYVAVPAYAWACGVSYSRMHLGVHYPTDILGGAVLGSASAWATWKINRWWQRKR